MRQNLANLCKNYVIKMQKMKRLFQMKFSPQFEATG